MTSKRAASTPTQPIDPIDVDPPKIGDIVLVQLGRPAPLPAIVTGLPGPGPFAIACEVFGTANGSHLIEHIGRDPRGVDVPSWRERA